MTVRTPGSPPSSTVADCRCACGSLLARLVAGGVELKCRRCKRTQLVPLEAGSPPPRPVTLAESPRADRLELRR